MNNQDNNSPATPSPAPAKAKGNPGFFVRLCVVLVVLTLSAAAIAVAVPWGRYRAAHIVLGEASIKGTVTRIGARLDGRVKSINAERGQFVRKGDVLLRMEDRHLQAALDRARSELISATKDLETEKMAIEQLRRRLKLDISRADAVRRKVAGELEAEQSNLTRWEVAYHRTAGLITNGAAAASELDRALGDRDRARGLVSAASAVAEGAESNYQKANNELEGLHVREARLAVLESQITVASTRVAAAEADMDAAVIQAPEDGRVLERLVESGGSAKVGEPILSLWTGRAWVEAWADERDLRKIQIGSYADISIDAWPDKRLTGRVESFGLMTDKQQQTSPVPTTLRSFVRQSAMIPVRIALEEDNSKLQLGLSVLVGIRKETEAPANDGPALQAADPAKASPAGLTKVQGGQ
jgi:membrane fusion protein (multidrug efflux system)